VTKTLEVGITSLQQEKTALFSEREELIAKLNASENNSKMLSEQVTFLNERNTTLSKKCVDLLDGSKEFREKFLFFKFIIFFVVVRAALYEDELKRIKPRYEEMEANFDAINEKNRFYIYIYFFFN
jgi:chromosome segregation ATPase